MGVLKVSFLGQGRRVASAGADGNVVIYSAQSGRIQQIIAEALGGTRVTALCELRVGADAPASRS
eukprot:3664943-Prorocentrum_lima.AAC.1